MNSASLLTFAVLASFVAAGSAQGQSSGAYDTASWNRGLTHQTHNPSHTYVTGTDSFSYADSAITLGTSALQGFESIDLHLTGPTYNGSNYTYAGGGADQSWIDQLTISNPLYTGQTGTITVTERLDAVGSTNNVEPYMAANLNVGGAGLGMLYANFSGNFPIDVHQNFTLAANFIYGTPFTISADAHMSGGNSNSGGQSFEFDGTLTTAWQGFQIQAPDTSLDTGFTTSSASGQDYTVPAAVPEPGSMSMLVLGIAALGLRRRRSS